ncbi:hypothetical protein PCIT_a4174 [Pseudoalteromonas citrea]|uniref:Uncharacterized protein n=1 Tax=Pseudoalteromonas citrea TaxID=43655 RepID=A0AAD4AI96_9GAMM|nr:hypothetical protein PCIT_a4174 [Pseudoalteromonas citrea]
MQNCSSGLISEEKNQKVVVSYQLVSKQSSIFHSLRANNIFKR